MNIFTKLFTNSQIKGRNNKIIAGGKAVRRISGLKIQITGNNNFISVANPNAFKNCNIFIAANNSKVEIADCLYMYDTRIRIIRADGQKFSFGKGSSIKGGDIRLCDAGGEIIIEDEVLMSDGICIWASDGHSIIDCNGKICNICDRAIRIGRHSWIGQNVGILKGTNIPANSIVAYGAVVNKQFEKENCVLAGSPAKIIKENVKWEELPPNINSGNKQ
jgi:acetyltransferase-like isoleucine patch superfamily enzyme